ncbi:MAG: amidase [Acidobacteriota bacterium]
MRPLPFFGGARRRAVPPRSLLLLLALAFLSTCAPRETTPPPASRALPRVEEVALAELQAGMAEGRFTSEELTAAYLKRIEEMDRGGPCLRAVLEVNPDALAIARGLDRERAEKGPRGPLHGIPVLIKDNIDSADGMLTTAGSLALTDSRPSRDAYVVGRLRRAGAVLLGKTNLSEWANFRSTRSTSGWSARGGQTRNPYALDRNPSGSSSGSAVAVAASLCALAVGTETDGSIVSPASACGIVGIKPSVGLVSRSGIIPIAHSQDTAGPMARTVADAAALLAVLAAPDPEDPASRESAGRALPDYAAGLSPEALQGARIGILREKAFGFGVKSEAVLDAAVAALRRAGALVVDPVSLPNLGRTDESEMEVLLYEFKADLNAYLASRPGSKVRTLADLIAFNGAHATRELPFFGQEIFEEAESKGPLTDREYLAAVDRNRRLMGPEGIDAALAKDRLDALVALTSGPAHLTDPVNGDSWSGSSSSPAAVAGYPAVTVPAGQVMGLPVGLTFMGGAWDEADLIRYAFAFEQAAKARRPPAYAPTAEAP